MTEADPIEAEALLKHDMVGKLPQVATPHSGWVEMVALWVLFDQVNRFFQLVPKAVVKSLRDRAILLADFTGVLGRTSVNN